MMKIDPGKSVGQIAIGMRREEYEAILGVSEDVFRRTPDDPNQVVAYDDRLMHLTVDNDRIVRSITVFRPEKVELQGIQLLGRELSDVEADLAQTRYGFSRVDAGLWSAPAGVVLVETDGIVDGVEVLPSAVMPDPPPPQAPRS
jgi:hypothetical protein